MGVELIVEPRKEYSKESFIKEKPPYSIALDGIISSPTFRLVEGPYANFDHHSGVDRLTTFSAAAQVNYEIQTGLFNTFSKEGKPYARLYVNSCDEDVAMSTWLLCNHQQHHGNKKLEELLYYQDKLDITGGMYADINTDMKEALGWIFEPFHIKKYSEKNLGILDEEQMKKVLFEIHERIDRYLLGETGKTAIESNYSIIKQTDKWALVEEQGPYARSELIKDGIQAFVSFIDEKTNHLGTFHDYTIAKASLWVAHFDIEKIYEHLNKEGRHITEHNRWGGTRIIGGSPRQTGSILTPEKIFKEINELNGDRPFWRKWFSFWK